MKKLYIFLLINIILSRVYADVVDGTIANFILTNRIYGIGDNISKVSDTHTTNVSTNCGGQFIRADPDITNGVAGLTFYVTNGIKNWGNATDIFILFIERSLDWLKSSGKLGFIISNRFTQSDYGKHIRKYIVDNSRILTYIDFGDSPFR